MMDTTSHPGLFRRIFHIKALHFEFLPPEQQLFLAEHYLAYCRQVLGTEAAEQRDLADDPLKRAHMSLGLKEGSLSYARLKQAKWRLELEWAEALREAVVARLKQPAPGD
jgi:hypothetical protein